MATDIRQEVHERRRVLAVLSKSIVEEKYSVIESVAKKMDIQLLLSRIEKQVPIAAKLLSPLQEQAITSQNTQIKSPKAEPIVSDTVAESTSNAIPSSSKPQQPYFSRAQMQKSNQRLKQQEQQREHPTKKKNPHSLE